MSGRVVGPQYRILLYHILSKAIFIVQAAGHAILYKCFTILSFTLIWSMAIFSHQPWTSILKIVDHLYERRNVKRLTITFT